MTGWLRVVTIALALGLGAALQSPAQEAVARFGTQRDVDLLVRSTTDIVILRPTLAAFVAENPDISITYEQWGSNALYDASRAACAGRADPSDVVFSSAVHQMVDLVNSACASPYVSAETSALPKTRVWRDELWGVTREAAVIIYNTALVPETDVPRDRFKLLDLMRRSDPAYHGKIATYDIEASGLGYLFAFVDSLEATTFGALLEGFSRTDVVATCCSAEIIQGVAEGRFLIAYNVLGSYVNTVPTKQVGVVLPSDYTFFLSRAFMIPRTAAHRPEAARLLDFLLSERGQAILAHSGLVAARDPDDSRLPASAERAIAIEPTLLVARDQHSRARLITQWRSAFYGSELE